MSLEWVWIGAAFTAGCALAWHWCRRSRAADDDVVRTQFDGMLKAETERTRVWEQLGHCSIPLIPILNAQMRSVIQQTEQAATELGVRFRTIATRASHQSQESTQLFRADDLSMENRTS